MKFMKWLLYKFGSNICEIVKHLRNGFPNVSILPQSNSNMILRLFHHTELEHTP